ncbi:condensation domain-containing protein [Streptomyces sp. NPDC052727]|uniref:condensation domain-containing protein n=1 Tax=unclassified Streptomyces TaxID=2593676 RepID=UPI003448A5A2
MTTTGISAQDRPEPVTAGQAAMFLASQKDPTGCSFTTEFTASVHGPLDRARVARAARALTAGTPALRLRMTIDPWTGEVVHSFSDQPLEVTWHTAAEDELPALLAAQTRRPVETDDEPLARLVVAEHRPGHHSVALIIHHLAMDGLSQIPLLRRLGLALAGRPHHEPEALYREAVRRVRDAERTAVREDRAHWHARVPSALELPRWDGPGARPDGTPQRPGPSGTLRRTLSASCAHGLIRRADEAGTRLTHLLTAAVHHAAPVRSGSPMAVCGAASVRPRKGAVGEVIGCFINEVPLLAQVAPGQSVIDTARAHQAGWREDLRRRNFPFAQLAARVAQPVPGEAAAIDSVVVSHRQLPSTLTWEHDGLRFSSRLHQRYPAAKTELAVRFFQDAGALTYEVQWGRDLPEGLGELFCARLLAVLQGL